MTERTSGTKIWLQQTENKLYVSSKHGKDFLFFAVFVQWGRTIFLNSSKFTFWRELSDLFSLYQQTLLPFQEPGFG